MMIPFPLLSDSIAESNPANPQRTLHYRQLVNRASANGNNNYSEKSNRVLNLFAAS